MQTGQLSVLTPITAPNSRMLWGYEASPTTTGTGITVSLTGQTGSRRKLYLKFDLSALTGKRIRQAFLRLMVESGHPTIRRTITVTRQKIAWDSGVNWNTSNGATAWQTPGGFGVNDEEFAFSQTVNEPSSGNPAFQIDITDMVQKWVSGTWANNGLAAIVDNSVPDALPIRLNDSFSNTLPLGTPALVIVYGDNNFSVVLPTAAKKTNAIAALRDYHQAGRWEWYSFQERNAIARAHQTGKGATYLTKLQAIYDTFIAADGTFLNAADATSIDKAPPLGQGLIYLYEQTLLAKYSTALTSIRNYIVNTAPRHATLGVITYGADVLTEISYFVTVFLARYADVFSSATEADLAITQSIALYDAVQQPDGIPYHFYNKASSKGWGRGMGWLFVGMAKLLKSPRIQAHASYGGLVSRFQALAATLLSYQQPSGMWRGIIHNSTTLPETSATAMIALSFEIGVAQGVLSASYRTAVDNAVAALYSYSPTGIDMSNTFPDLNSTYIQTEYNYTTFGFGAWLELILEVDARP